MMNHQDVIVAKQAEEETINKVKQVGTVIHKIHPRDNVMVLTVAAGRDSWFWQLVVPGQTMRIIPMQNTTLLFPTLPCIFN